MNIKKISFTLLLLVFLIAGCQNNEQPQAVTGKISIAPRGESKLSPIVKATEVPVSTATVVQLEVVDPTSTFSAEIESIVTAVVEQTPSPSSLTQQDESSASCEVFEDRSLEAQVIALMNAEREKYGMGALVEQSQITLVARQHSEDMACNNFFDHVSPITNTVIDRVEQVEFEYVLIGENIAAGYLTPAEVFEAWMDSETHRDNILNPDYTVVGVGYVYLSGSDYGSYWTAVYARP